MSAKINPAKWAKGSVLYNPADNEINLVTFSHIRPDEVLGAAFVEDSDGRRFITVSPEGTKGVTVWTKLGQL